MQLMRAHVPLLLLILILTGSWIYLFTDFFPAFGSVIGLAGILAVVPAMGGLMTEARRQRYVSAIDSFLFQHRLTVWAYLVVIVFVAPLAYGFLIPLRISYESAGAPLSVTVSKVPPKGEARHISTMTLKAFSETRLPLTWSLGGQERIRLESPGFPQLELPLSFALWHHQTLPTDYWSTPLLILRPDADQLPNFRQRNPRLFIQVSQPGELRKCPALSDYLGEPVWVGGGSGPIEVPSRLTDQWLLEAQLLGITRQFSLASESVRTILASARMSCIETLRHGSTVSWFLKHRIKDTVLGSGSVQVLPTARYPQNVFIGIANQE